MRRALLMIVILMLIGCDNANGGGTDTSTTPTVEKQTYTSKYKEQLKPIEINLDDLSFSEAFNIEHRAKGEGHTFWWNGNEYTTNLLITYENGDLRSKLGWVRNSDDMDDHCRSNTWDDCGLCDGKGPFTWYIDRDGDGLGDPSTYTKDCKYPSVDEE